MEHRARQSAELLIVQRDPEKAFEMLYWDVHLPTWQIGPPQGHL